MMNARRGMHALLSLMLGAPMLVGACAAPPQRSDESASSRSEAPVDDRARLAQLEREARALAKIEGCATTAQCRTAPIGWRGCGGPRTYLPYCAASTDSVALFRKLDALKEAEIAYNQKSGMMSTCEMRLPPTVTAQGGSCRESR
ncbi:MAG: hypothetical protein JWL95_2141 [Gemmatimonadetes bacterium]|nr:hypothetical protein [Gemmatimonadota bacterium]